jgi:DNA-nicking Smr family endonuclease
VLDPPLTRPQGLPAIPTFRLGEAAPPPPATRIDLAPAAAPPGPSALPLDRRTRSRLARGTTGPEARIDLHGMTLAEAQSALTRFVLAQQTQGRRLVLVITGKGRPGDSGGPVPERPGVLRRHVPEWLRRPPLAAAVVAVTQAHLRHGGSGAYYVALRRLR